MLKLFLDTEFTGLYQYTELISIAIVAETGEEFYAEFTDFNKDKVSSWVEDNVVAHLFVDAKNQSFDLRKMHLLGNRNEVKSALLIWLNQFALKKDIEGNILPSLQFWADVPHYDWVLFCELFGGALNIPKNIYYMCFDLATLIFSKTDKCDNERNDIIDITKMPNFIKLHNALYDAHQGRLIYQTLLEY